MRLIFITFLLIGTICSYGQNKPVNAVSDIQSVIVFSSGARIERTANANVSAGRSEISFKGLSNQLDPQSVQLSANTNITLLSVQAIKDYVSERKLDEEEKRFLDSINGITSQLNLEKKMLEVYKNEETMLIKNQAIGGESGVKPADLKEALDLQSQRLTLIYKKQLESEANIERYENRLRKFREQLQEFSKKKDSVNYIVTALIESKSAANIKFQLSYNIKDAGWYPTYDVRIKDINDPLSFLMSANVFQRSGETWKNVSISLSTGSPHENVTPAELQPWHLGFYNPSVPLRSQIQTSAVTGRITNDKGEPVSGATIVVKGTSLGVISDANGFFRLNDVPLSATAQISMVGYEIREVKLLPGYTTVVLKELEQDLNEVVVTGLARGLQGKVAGVQVENLNMAKAKKNIELAPVLTEYEPTTLVYKIDKKYSIETDGKTTTIGVKDFDVPATYRYFSAPKTDPSSFLTAHIADWQDYDLQSGEVSLYFEGSYLGKTYLDLSSVSDTLNLSLGKDNGVRISRQMVKEYSKKRLIGSNQTDSRQYEITVRNTKKEVVFIRVQDQFPLSITKDISVSDMKAPEGKIDDKTGIVNWDIQLNPGAEKKLLMSFEVKYPKDRKVVLE